MRFWSLVWLVSTCQAQVFTERGFVEMRGFFYPQTAPGDSGHAVAEWVLDYEATWRPIPSFRLRAEAEMQTDTHREAERRLHLSWLDRELQRPAFAVRGLSVSYSKGRLTLEGGKQLIRWGKADILNPTDHFAARDFLNVVRTEFLGTTAAHLTYGDQSNSLELVAAPVFIPSRMPLLNQRWGGVPPNISIVNQPTRYPGGTQLGGRWNHIGKAAEFSLSYFQGFHTLPLIEGQLLPQPVPAVAVQRFYPRLRSYGADLAVPLRAVGFKAEAAYYDSRTNAADRYLLWVAQLERQSGEWSFVGGYSGQVVTRATPIPSFDPDRGLTRAFLGRAGYTIDTNRSFSLQAAIRQNGHGVWVKAEYSEAFQQHWRLTAGIAVIRGSGDDFFSPYRRNSYASLALRYSF
jgi:hypothetical protein